MSEGCWFFACVLLFLGCLLLLQDRYLDYCLDAERLQLGVE